MAEVNFDEALKATMESYYEELLVQMCRPKWFLHTPEEIAAWDEEEFRLNHRYRRTAHGPWPSECMPEQIYLYPDNYEWWCLPEEDDEDCDC